MPALRSSHSDASSGQPGPFNLLVSRLSACLYGLAEASPSRYTAMKNALGQTLLGVGTS